MWGFSIISWLVVSLFYIIHGEAPPSKLLSPFNVAQRQQQIGKPWLEAYDCPTPIKPSVNIIAQSYYIDEAKTVIDQSLFQKNLNLMQPIQSFLRFVGNSSVDYLSSNPPFLPAAECTLQWLNHWAKGKAMLGRVNKQGDDHRGWCIAAMMTSFLLIRDEPRLNQTTVKFVGEWLHTVARTNIAYFIKSGHVWNNHLTWTSLIALEASVVANDRMLFADGLRYARYTISTIQANGSLPYEIRRHERAAHYFYFSLTALMPIAEFAMANGVDLYRENGGALHRLINLSIRTFSDPTIIQRANGYVQERHSKEDYSWLEIYYARFNDSRAIPYLRQFRPLFYWYSGGDVTKIWGKPLPGSDVLQ
eukprot:gene27985-33794_t